MKQKDYKQSMSSAPNTSLTAKNGGEIGRKPEGSKTYTCPMHPEIDEEKPGKCPKCGMDLVLKKEVR